MAIKKVQEYECRVVKETVLICLRNRRSVGLGSKDDLYVKCDQEECQYVEENKLPCPLSLILFEEEIEERKKRAQVRREESEYR